VKPKPVTSNLTDGLTVGSGCFSHCAWHWWCWGMFTVGADIIMQLDDVVHSSVSGPRLEEATFRSTVVAFMSHHLVLSSVCKVK